MLLPDDLKVRLISGIVMFSSAVFVISLGGFFYTSAIILLSLFCAAEFFTIVSTSASLSDEEFKKWIYKGVLFIGIPAISLYIIRSFFVNGIMVSLWFFIIVSMVDICAYFTGKFFGKRKLVPNISPSKTIEGLIGGVALATIVSIGFFFLFNSKLNFLVFVIFSLALCIVSQLSDILESAFKRKFQVKDSSNLIPGHGGFLDRLDGYFLTGPLLVIFYFINKSIFGVVIF